MSAGSARTRLRGGAIPRHSGRWPEPHHQVPENVLRLLQSVDDRATVTELVNASGLADEAALDALEELIRRGWIAIDD